MFEGQRVRIFENRKSVFCTEFECLKGNFGLVDRKYVFKRCFIAVQNFMEFVLLLLSLLLLLITITGTRTIIITIISIITIIIRLSLSPSERRANVYFSE